MALRMSWRGELGDDPVTVYWFLQEPDWRTGYVAQALGVMRLWGEDVDAPGTPDEISGWTAAATVYVDEVGVAAAELERVQLWAQRRRRWPVPLMRRWTKEKTDEAEALYRHRVRAAASAYQPVRDAIEERITDQQVLRLEETRRAKQEQERLRREAKPLFEAWQRRQAVADRRLPGGLTPRGIAALGDNPRSWPPQVEAAVGDLDTWWAGVRASVRNEHARVGAARKVSRAIIATATALDRADAGRTLNNGFGGLAQGGRIDRWPYGWRLSFRWSNLADVARRMPPPDMPVGHLHEGSWSMPYLPSYVLFGPFRSGNFCLGREAQERIGTSTRFRSVWAVESTKAFTEKLFPT